MEFDELVTLEEVTTKIGDGLHGTPKYDENGTYYFINGNNLSNGNIIFKETTKKVNEDEFKKYQKPLNDRTLFVSINGTIGNTAVYNNEDIILGKSACYLNVKNSIDKDFIYYLLNNNHFQNYIDQYATGTTIKNVSLKTIRGYKFELPSIKKQKSISIILKNIDKKIQVNQQIIANLEELSQTLFKRWFIDFEFPDENGNPYKSSGGGMVNTFSRNIPENWDVLELKELLTNTKNNIKPGEYTKTHPYVPIDLIPMKKLNFYEYKDGCEAKSSLLKFDKNDILLGSMRVYFHRVSLAPYSGTTRSTVFVLKPKHEYLTYYLLHFINQKDFISFASNSSSGSTIPYAVWNDTLENYLTILPSKKVLDDFNNRVKNLFDISQNLLLENKNLIELRDSLLPKLMSGEIELPDELEVDEHAELLQ